MDYFLYSGDIEPEYCFRFIDLVETTQSSFDVTLVLSTYGGDANSAYKIGRRLQSRYKGVRIFVPGICKSAGTLLAIAANELVFSPSGELGPLDVQMIKRDSVAGRESGSDTKETFDYLEFRAKNVFHELVDEIVHKSNGSVSFQTASRFAVEIASSLHGPIFARMNPEEIGKTARAMRIAECYGIRLNWSSNNLQNAPYALRFLTWECPCHDFVIDMTEADLLFENVRQTNEVEENLVTQYQEPESKIEIKNITDKFQKIETEEGKNKRRNSEKSKATLTASNEAGGNTSEKT